MRSLPEGIRSRVFQWLDGDRLLVGDNTGRLLVWDDGEARLEEIDTLGVNVDALACTFGPRPRAVVCAGMEGALPAVVRGLLHAPVIGVPVSTGYGYGGRGEGALMTMLQSCAPGLTVVNIDNGFGAGATAALIANRMAAKKA